MDTVKMNPSMPDANQCPQCGTSLPSGALAGLCPACLLKMGAAADTVTDAKSPPFNPPSVAELAPLFPQLEILELIGKGGMGAVYKARQKQLDRIVALKILPPGIGHDAAFAERFTREAKALAKLNHPGIVTLYEFGSASGYQPSTLNSQLFYFLMEFVDGVNLRQLLHAGRISAREALAIVPQICDALQFAHDQGIVHRDIKPENILLDRRGRVKVADFGLAKIIGVENEITGGEKIAASATLTDAGKIMGTPNYMSPEQKENPGEVDNRADIYALGVVFYQMLTGELPGKKIAPPSTKVQIDVRLDEIVLRALEKNPALRYQQVSEVKTRVETIAATPPGSSRREEAQTEKYKIRNPKSETQPSFLHTTLVVALLIAIIGSPIALFLNSKVKTRVVTLNESEFLQKFASNQIAHATISLNPQLATLMQIQGTYYQADKDGVIVKQSNGKPVEVPFEMPNGLLTEKMKNDLLMSPKIKLSSPNSLPLSIGYQLLFFVGIGSGILLIPGIIIYIVWRAVKKSLGNPAPPPNQKPDHFWRWFAVVVLALISIPILISIVGLLAAIAIPNFVKARARAQENARLAAKIFSSNSASNFYIGQTNFPKGDDIEITSVERNENHMTVKGHYNLVSADEASLWLNITATNNDEVPNQAEPPQSMHISKGRGDFELSHFPPMSGLPHVSMYDNHHSFADIYFGNEAEAAAESKLDLAPAASAETWSPTFAPDEKPDLQKILNDAKDLMDKGDYEAALQRHIWYFNHALEYDQGQTGVRLSFALSQWVELGRRYPKAKQALLEIRDRDTHKLATGQGYANLFTDVQAINRELQDEDATYALFKTIREKDPQLAGQCYFWVESLLVSKGEYQWCFDHMGDAQSRFDMARRSFDMERANQQRMVAISQRIAQQMAAQNQKRGITNLPVFAPPDTSAMMKKFAEDRFVGQVRQLIEILVATDHKTDAEKIQDEAIEVLDDARLKSAVGDAEEKVRKKLMEEGLKISNTNAGSITIPLFETNN